MPQRQQWTDHVFPFGIDTGWSQNIRTRVADTPMRLRHHTNNLSTAQLTQQLSGQWSMQEHIGHLIDLETLHTGRLQQFAALVPELTAADMSNAATEAANHNTTSIADLLQHFSAARKKLLQTFDALSEASLQHEAFHPRLKIMMRPVDILFFAAEHDDHHLTTMLEIKQALQR